MGSPKIRVRARAIPLSLLILAIVAAPAAARGEENPRERPYPHGAWKEDCELCHKEEQWLPATISPKFDHSKYFKLQGAHRSVACRACHKSLEFSRAGKSCVDCHQDVHRGELGLDCSRCHTTRNFIDRAEAVRTHRTTRFPLSGAHAVADCEACHRPAEQGQLSFLALPVDCPSCHATTGFPAASQRPADHVAANFPLDCSECHSTASFGAAKFNHAGTGFPLTGAHVGLACSACHGDGVYRGKPTACLSCHQSQYDSTTNPNHRAAGFGTSCTDCHNTSAWTGARYLRHDSIDFPIYSGTHNNRWSACSDCHTDPNNYLTFSCFQCHSKPDMDSAHSAVSGYAYDNNACYYTCHRNGTVP